MSAHRIRLIGPWEFAWHSSAAKSSGFGEAPECGTIKMPCDWQSIFGSRGGVVTFSRRFHRPTNLEPHEQVLIVLTGVGGTGAIRLNGSLVMVFTGVDETEINVTKELQFFNCLEVELEHHPVEGDRGGLYAPVVLEIRQS